MKSNRKVYSPEQPKARPTGPPPRPTPTPWPKIGIVGQLDRRAINWGRVGDWVAGFGLGLLVGAVAALLFLGQLGQWAGR